MIAGILNGWEIVLILAVVLVLFGAQNLAGIAKGLGKGFEAFRDAADDASHDAGRSLGGIYGKPAREALTPQNQVAELYDPAALRRTETSPNRKKMSLVRRLIASWRRACHLALRLLNVRK